MLAVIAELVGAVPAAPPPVLTERKPQDAAERRQLTLMFCDLVGSTALSARCDPEDLRGIIGTYHRCCTELVERNGGFVAKYTIDCYRESGAGDGNRTHDIQLGKLSFYH